MGEVKLNIKHVSILRALKIEDEYLYDLLVQYDNGVIKRGLKLPFKCVKGKKEIIRFPSIIKVRDWLNTDEGKIYLEKVFNNKEDPF